MVSDQRPWGMLTAADCGSSLSSLRIYRDHASILTFEFKYQDGTSYATGGTTDEYDDLVFQPNECLVKIEQTMDMDQTDGDGSGHRRRAEMEGEQELRRGIFSFSRNVIRLHRVRGTRARRRAHHSPFFYTHLSHSHHHRSPSSFPQSLIP